MKNLRSISLLIIFTFIFTTVIFANSENDLPIDLPHELEQDYMDGYVTTTIITEYDEQNKVTNVITEYYSFKEEYLQLKENENTVQSDEYNITRNILPNIVLSTLSKVDDDRVKVVVNNVGVDPIDYYSASFTTSSKHGIPTISHNIVHTNFFVSQSDTYFTPAWSSATLSNIYIKDGNQSATASPVTIFSSN